MADPLRELREPLSACVSTVWKDAWHSCCIDAYSKRAGTGVPVGALVARRIRCVLARRTGLFLYGKSEGARNRRLAILYTLATRAMRRGLLTTN